MNNFFSRFLLVAVAIPALYAIVVLLPYRGHGAIVLVAVIFSAGCGVELSRLFRLSGVRSEAALSGLLAALPAIALWVLLRFPPGAPGSSLQVFLAVYCLIFLAVQAPIAFPSSKENMSGALAASSARAFPLIYPGVFTTALVLIADYPVFPSQVILWFALLVFGNDSMAWAVGMLFGKHRGIVLVSPSKSLEGFVGAYTGSLVAAFLGPVFFPHAIQYSPVRLVVLGLSVGSAVILGDLFESALKRSAGAKDSGTAIPGRGGFLDTFDSILFAAPVFYAALRLLKLV